MMSPGKKNGKAIAFAMGTFLFAAYRVSGPYLEDTRAIRNEIEQTEKQIKEVETTALSYAPPWSQKQQEREDKVRKQLPQKLESGDVLDYFLSRFEQANSGHVVFSAVTYQSAALTDIKAANDPKGSRARSLKYRFLSQMSEDRVLSYLQHMEKYEGLFEIEEFSFQVPPKGNVVDAAAVIQIFLQPAEWFGDVPPPQREVASESSPWTPLFLAKGAPETSANVVVNLPSPPRVEAIFGNGFLFDESIFEEGDSVRGWKVTKIDSNRREVFFRRGGRTVKVGAP